MYQFQNKNKYKNNTFKVILILIVVILFFVLGIISWTGGFFHSVGSPFWKARNSLDNSVSLVTSSISRSKKSIILENESLRNKYTELEFKMIDYSLLQSENEHLKELLGRVKPSDNYILGTILTKPNRSPYDTIIIDVGEKDGVVVGEQVFGNIEIPIGRISEVYASTSLVILYSSPKEVTEAIISESNATVELVGRGAGNFEMVVPLDLTTEKGGLVLLPNINLQTVAIIQEVLSKPTDPMKKVLLRSPINIQELKWVEVRKN